MNAHLVGFLWGLVVCLVVLLVYVGIRLGMPSRKLPRFAVDIDPARFDEYEAAIARLRKRFSVKKPRRPRKPKAPVQVDLLTGQGTSGG